MCFKIVGCRKQEGNNGGFRFYLKTETAVQRAFWERGFGSCESDYSLRLSRLFGGQ
jgi:hypothetical protein